MSEQSCKFALDPPPIHPVVMSKIYHGTCLCRSIKYTITGEPFTFYVCHCVNCRKATGSAFMANAFFKPEQVSIIEGNEQIKTFRDTATGSGQPFLRSFCSSCGSCLFLKREDAASYMLVATGAVEEEVDWVPRKQIYPDGKRRWVEGITTNSPKSKL